MTLLNIMSPLKDNFRLRSILGGLCILIVSASAYSSQSVSDWNSNSEARTRLLTPFGLEADGRTLWIGLEIQLEDGWHSYWKNPGDAGLPPEFTISDSGIIEALEINFTPPKFYPFGGGLDANGYADEVVYPIKLTLSESAASQTEVDLELGMFYLVCKHLCIPHDEDFKTLVLLTNSSSAGNVEGNTAQKLKAALALLPEAPADVPGYSVTERLTRDGDDYLLSIKVNLAEQSQEFPEIFFHATPDFKLGQTSFQVGESRTEIIIQVPIRTKVAGKKITKADFGYLLTKIKSGEKYISIEKEVHLAVSDGEPFGDTVRVGATASVSDSGDAMPLWKVILFALLGGLILNIMPCVLPVLSIKLMGVVQHSGESHGKIARGMLASSAGITTSFLALALAAVIAKSAGAAVGWGVQFQEPIFVTFLAVIVFLFGLNLWGVFEVTLPSSVSSGAVRSASGRGHFVQGMFATLLATPCSAPFLGTAVSFALSSPGWIIYSVFAAMGIGMSLPYLVIAAAPGAIRYLPRPGAWMETARIFFGFLLMGTVIWLMYVLSLQAGSDTLAFVWLGLLIIGLIVWLKKALAPTARFFGSAGGFVTVFSILAVSGYSMYLAGQSNPAGSANLYSSDSDIHWTAFSEEAVREHLAAGEVVFVDVTAEWCITCKFNEKFFIETDDIIDRINRHGIATLKADWTNRNREIGDFLAQYGRSGIPFYIIYYGGDQSNYITLPITITGSLLARKLDEAVERNKSYTGSPSFELATPQLTP